jgi:hypothetical protein
VPQQINTIQNWYVRDPAQRGIRLGTRQRRSGNPPYIWSVPWFIHVLQGQECKLVAGWTVSRAG